VTIFSGDPGSHVGQSQTSENMHETEIQNFRYPLETHVEIKFE